MLEFNVNSPFKMLKISSENSANNSKKKSEEEKLFHRMLDPILTEGDLDLEEFQFGCHETLSRLLRRNKYDIIYFQVNKNLQGQYGIKINQGQIRFLLLNDLAGLLTKKHPPFLIVADKYSGNYPQELAETFFKKGVAKTLILSALTRNDGRSQIVPEFFKELVRRIKNNLIETSVEESLEFVGLNEESQPTAFLTSNFGRKDKVLFKATVEDKNLLLNKYMVLEPQTSSLGRQRFIGRLESMARMETAIEKGVKVLGICGEAGIGKTFFFQQLGETLLKTSDETLAVEKIFFINGCRYSNGSYGDLIGQLEKVFHRSSEIALSQVILNQKDYPTPKEKAHALSKFIGDRSLFFVFDNFEFWLNHEDSLKDSLLKDFIETFIKTTGPKAKFLFVAKKPVIFSKEINLNWVPLNLFTKYERLSFLNSFKQLNSLPFEEKWEISEVCGGIPFDLNLFVHNLGIKSERRNILKKLRDENVSDFFLDKLSKNCLELLRSRALFLESSLALPVLEAFWYTLHREQEKDFSSFSTNIKALVEKGILIPTKEPGDGTLRVFIQPILRNKLLGYAKSKFAMPKEEIQKRWELISEFYYALFYAQLEKDPKSAYSYLAECLEYALLAGNPDVIAEFLDMFLAGDSSHISNGKIWKLFDNLSKMFLALKANEGFLELVRKMGCKLAISHPILAEKILSQWHNHSLVSEKEKILCCGILGQINFNLGNLEASLKNFNIYISSGYPEIEKTFGDIYYVFGKLNHKTGNMQEAINCFRKSIDWSEKLGEQTRLGKIYGHLGKVFEEIIDLDSAVENYELAIKSYEEREVEKGTTELYICLGNAYLKKESWLDSIKSFATALERGKKAKNIYNIESSYNGLASSCAGQGQWDQMKGLLFMAVEAIAPSKHYQKERSITLENIKINRAKYNNSDWDSLKEILPKILVENLKNGSFRPKQFYKR